MSYNKINTTKNGQKFTPVPPQKTGVENGHLVTIRNNERYAKYWACGDLRKDFVITQHRQKIYALQGKSAKILAPIFYEKNGIQKQTHRVVHCTHRRISAENGVFVYVNTETAKAQYGNLMLCGSVWTCPKCANRITTARSAEVLQAIKGAPAFGFLTLTTPHHKAMPLAYLLAMQAQAKEIFYRSHRVRRMLALLGVHGRITATECTYGEVNGWHPHYHALLFLDRPVSYDHVIPFMPHKIWTPAPCKNRHCFGEPAWRFDEIPNQIFFVDFVALARDELAHQWINACHDAGMDNLPTVKHGLDLQAITDAKAMAKIADYMTKYGCMPAPTDGDGMGRINNELTKWHSKTKVRTAGEPLTGLTPFEILSMADTDNPNCPYSRLWIEFANAFKGKRQLDWSAKLKERYGIGEQSDDDIVNATDEKAEQVFEITYTVWRLICQRNERTKPLELAEQDYQDNGSRLYDYCIDVLIDHIEQCKVNDLTPCPYVMRDINNLLQISPLDVAA
ncbi:protein rep [Moraxella pluranimalium]|uniref:Replication protein n=1 Tax=Moraxella pluranimalium TaxID=470453 RepID=A0A1T0CG46_9GAMM|nr:protein rep [Moraxella pluranimalium]OOS21294.1 hypothetical protein B0680_10030 [Moraxella pluranimalium]